MAVPIARLSSGDALSSTYTCLPSGQSNTVTTTFVVRARPPALRATSDGGGAQVYRDFLWIDAAGVIPKQLFRLQRGEGASGPNVCFLDVAGRPACLWIDVRAAERAYTITFGYRLAAMTGPTTWCDDNEGNGWAAVLTGASRRGCGVDGVARAVALLCVLLGALRAAFS